MANEGDDEKMTTNATTTTKAFPRCALRLCGVCASSWIRRYDPPVGQSAPRRLQATAKLPLCGVCNSSWIRVVWEC